LGETSNGTYARASNSPTTCRISACRFCWLLSFPVILLLRFE
jgi:hypothetical protein